MPDPDKVQQGMRLLTQSCLFATVKLCPPDGIPYARMGPYVTTHENIVQCAHVAKEADVLKGSGNTC